MIKKTIVIWSILLCIALLIVFSVYGAFLGAEKATLFFNSVPLSIFWILFFFLCIAGMIKFPGLHRKPPLLLLHAGVMIVLLGAMWGSEKGHQIQKRIFGIDKIRTGELIIYEDMQESRVLRDGAEFNFGIDENRLVFFEGNRLIRKDDERVFLLPFEVRLNDFRMQYHEVKKLMIQSRQGKTYILQPVKTGTTLPLDPGETATVAAVYRNFKIRRTGDAMEAYDQTGTANNPAVKLLIKHRDGSVTEQFVFARHTGHMERQNRYRVRYQFMRMVSDYFSDLQVIQKGQVLCEKTIQVNDPLHYGGYHFYQSSYDVENGRFTILTVASDSGLYLVYAGYLFLITGIIWQLWIVPLLAARKRNRNER